MIEPANRSEPLRDEASRPPDARSDEALEREKSAGDLKKRPLELAKLAEEQKKLCLEQDKLALEIRELKRPLWQRNLQSVIAIVTATLGISGTAALTIYTTNKASYEATQRAMASRAVSDINSPLFSSRVGAATVLGRLDSPFNFLALKEAYARSLDIQSTSVPGMFTPFIRVGAMEAMFVKEIAWGLDVGSKTSMLTRGLSDRSPLVRRKALLGLWTIGERNVVEKEFRKDLRNATSQMIRLSGVGVVGSDQFTSRETPEQEVSIPAFDIDRDLVTNKQWNQLMGTVAPAWEERMHDTSTEMGRRRRDPKFEDYPVLGISFSQAKKFCEEQGKRLPTETQWELAARGEPGWTYPWGESESPAEELIKRENAAIGQPRIVLWNLTRISETVEVKSATGAIRLAGSLRQWVDTEFKESRGNPSKNQVCEKLCTIKGSAAFESIAERTAIRFRASRRSYVPIGAVEDNIGFRCVSKSEPPRFSWGLFGFNGSWLM